MVVGLAGDRAVCRVRGHRHPNLKRFAFDLNRIGLPKPQGRPAGQFGKLAPHRDFLLKIVQAEPDITLKELAAALAETHGVEVQLSSLHRALERAGLSYKKRTDRSGT